MSSASAALEEDDDNDNHQAPVIPASSTPFNVSNEGFANLNRRNGWEGKGMIDEGEAGADFKAPLEK